MTENLGYSHRTTEEANLLGHVGVPFPMFRCALPTMAKC